MNHQQPFILTDIQFSYTPRSQLVGQLEPPPPTKTGIRSAIVTCTRCGHAWKAYSPEFEFLVGAIRITCANANCRHTSQIPLPPEF